MSRLWNLFASQFRQSLYRPPCTRSMAVNRRRIAANRVTRRAHYSPDQAEHGLEASLRSQATGLFRHASNNVATPTTASQFAFFRASSRSVRFAFLTAGGHLYMDGNSNSTVLTYPAMARRTPSSV